MEASKFIAEHKKLVKVLKKKAPKELDKEASEQYAELKRFCKKEGIKCGKL